MILAKLRKCSNMAVRNLSDEGRLYLAYTSKKGKKTINHKRQFFVVDSCKCPENFRMFCPCNTIENAQRYIKAGMMKVAVNSTK